MTVPPTGDIPNPQTAICHHRAVARRRASSPTDSPARHQWKLLTSRYTDPMGSDGIVRCVCGCDQLIDPGAPSQLFAGDECQQRWNLARLGLPADHGDPWADVFPSHVAAAAVAMCPVLRPA